MKFKTAFLASVLSILTLIVQSQTLPISIYSPNKKIRVEFGMDELKQAYYSVMCNNERVLKPSKLGLVRQDDKFVNGLKFVNASTERKVSDKYELLTGKRRFNNYLANARTFHLLNSGGKKMDITFHVSNDGVAFRYYFPEKSSDVKTITEEVTSYNFNSDTKAFLQAMSVAKSGWEKTNPAYEEHYKQGITVGTSEPTKAGWVYPALFNYHDTWLLITEASLDSNYCGTRLKPESPNGEYSVGFPDEREVLPGGRLLPNSKLPFYSPWRIITIGPLKTIVESTLGTDLARPSITINRTFIKPGRSTWSWIMSKDDFIVYDEQKKYVDFAADMKWEYCLIDVNWDQKIGYDKIKELSDYAASKNVGLLLWYNSAGSWNTVKYTPKDKLLTRESRIKEFERIKSMGIKGVKIDFFGGDGQSVINYYHDILVDAAKVGLMVNFHGATLPRGWHRTYPHLVTTEAVRGFEMVTFTQADADAQPTHCAMLPFTRNAFDPMDFTPMNLYRIPTRVKRKTTSAFELATSVLFLSGIQHFAESPDGMTHVPPYVKDFLRVLPTRWDDVEFIDGYPGKHVVIARKAGNKWYIAGINGEDKEKRLQLNLPSFKAAKATFITDGEQPLTFTNNVTPFDGSAARKVTMKPNGGFVLVLE